MHELVFLKPIGAKFGGLAWSRKDRGISGEKLKELTEILPYLSGIIFSLQKMPSLYIIAGCNGAGKTTASYTILPKVLDCVEFVNADNIAAGLSPFNVENVAFEAGRIMLQRVSVLMTQKVDFALETTLSTRSYVSLIHHAHEIGYEVTLLYFWFLTYTNFYLV